MQRNLPEAHICDHYLVEMQGGIPMRALSTERLSPPPSPSSINTVTPPETSPNTVEKSPASPVAEDILADSHTNLNENQGNHAACQCTQGREESKHHDKDQEGLYPPDSEQAQEDKGSETTLEHSRVHTRLSEGGTERLSQHEHHEPHANKSSRRWPVQLKPLEIPPPQISTTLSLRSGHRTRSREDSLSAVDINYRDTLFDLFQEERSADVASPGSLDLSEDKDMAADIMRPDSPTQGAYLNGTIGFGDPIPKASILATSSHGELNDCSETTTERTGREKRNKYDIESESGSDTECDTEAESPPPIPPKSSLRHIKAYTAISEASRQDTSLAEVEVAEDKVETQGPPAIPLKSPLRDVRLYTRIAEASRRRHNLKQSNDAPKHSYATLGSPIDNPPVPQSSPVSPTSVLRNRSKNWSPDSTHLARTVHDRRRGGGDNEHMDAYHSFLWQWRKPRTPSSPKDFVVLPASEYQRRNPLSATSHRTAQSDSDTENKQYHALSTSIPLRGGGDRLEASPSPSVSPPNSLRSSKRASRGLHLLPQHSRNYIDDVTRAEPRTGLAANIPTISEYPTDLPHAQYLDLEIARNQRGGTVSIFSFGESTFPSSASEMIDIRQAEKQARQREHEGGIQERRKREEIEHTTGNVKDRFLEEVVWIRKLDLLERGRIQRDGALSEEEKIEKTKEVENKTKERFLKAKREVGYNSVDDKTAIRVALGGGSSSEPSTAQQPKPSSPRASPLRARPVPVPHRERWVSAAVSKAGKVLWKGVKVALAVPTDEDLKSYSHTHPPLGHTPMHIPMGTGAFATTPYRPRTARSSRLTRQRFRQRPCTSNGDSRSVRSMRSIRSVRSTIGSSVGGTTWPTLDQDDYGSQLRSP